MMYTFEITIAGCATNCTHCYIDGGPAAQMKLGNYRYCIEKLIPLLNSLKGKVAVTLGNELFCHRDITEIISFANEMIPQYFSYHDYPVPTTAVALIGRRDFEKIIHEIKKAGAKGFMLAIHGDEKNHNAVVGNDNAYASVFKMADYLAAHNLGMLFNLMVSKTLCADFEAVAEKIAVYPTAEARLTVPLYVPTKRMKEYQKNRANHQECIYLADRAEKYGIDTSQLWKCCQEHCEDAVIAELCSGRFDYNREKADVPEWRFFNITQKLDVYYGNAGAHTRYLGNLLDLSSQDLLTKVLQCDPNYDYTAFYPEQVYYTLSDIVRTLPKRKENYVYPSKADCIYSLLDEIMIENSLI